LSADYLLSEPDLVTRIHRDYIDAGALVITTNTYSASCTRMAMVGMEDKVPMPQERACELAIKAREQSGQARVAIAGSLPPLNGTYRPDRVRDIQVNLDEYSRLAALQAPYVDLFICETMSTSQEARALRGAKHYNDWDSGYSKQQATRPQTLGYGLTDSPSGQAAWILEKFWAWTDCDGHPENILSRDELLDNLMLYWVTASATSSARIYWESFGGRRKPQKVHIPTGVAVFPKEIVAPVRRWMEDDFTDIRHWTEMTKGGHFSAFEQPAAFVDDVRKFFRALR
jgi:pimeloyl-ACP methyl ester carboxylesterase